MSGECDKCGEHAVECKCYNRYKGGIYIPPYKEPQAQNATLGVKFCQDTFLMRSFLDQFKIPYKEEELEDGPLGKGIRIKKETK